MRVRNGMAAALVSGCSSHEHLNGFLVELAAALASLRVTYLWL